MSGQPTPAAARRMAGLLYQMADCRAEVNFETLDGAAGLLMRCATALPGPENEPTDANLLELAHAHKYRGPPEADLRILAMLRAARNWSHA